MILALGLSFAQPASSSGELFRVGHAEIVDTRHHHRVAPGADEPPMPRPDERVTWYIVLWAAADLDDSLTVTALARGDPRFTA